LSQAVTAKRCDIRFGNGLPNPESNIIKRLIIKRLPTTQSDHNRECYKNLQGRILMEFVERCHQFAKMLEF